MLAPLCIKQAFPINHVLHCLTRYRHLTRIMSTKSPQLVVTEKPAMVGHARPRWPLWKQITVLGLSCSFIVALSLSLGVGQRLQRLASDDSNDVELQGDVFHGSDDDSSSALMPRATTWKPEVGTPWQIVLIQPIKLDKDGSVKTVKPDVAIWDLDLYDNDKETFAALHKAGKHVICYFSAGSWENWRDDQKSFKKEDLGKALDGWPGEKWLNVKSQSVRNIMKKRIKLAADKGCDAIDPDNVDGYVSFFFAANLNFNSHLDSKTTTALA